MVWPFLSEDLLIATYVICSIVALATGTSWARRPPSASLSSVWEPVSAFPRA